MNPSTLIQDFTGRKNYIPNINCDATYKLLLNGFIVLVLGTVDANRRFINLSYAITNKENSHSYKLLFLQTNEQIKKLYNIDLRPQIIMSDQADYILNASKEVYGDDVINQLCLFHLIKTTKSQLNKKSVRNHSGIILLCVYLLVETKSTKQMYDLWKIIKPYWKTSGVTDEFISKLYFLKYRINKHYNNEY